MKPMSLHIRPAVVGIQAESTPVVIGIVRVCRQLQQDLRVLSGLGRQDDKEATGLNGPSTSLHKLAPSIFRLERDVVIPTAPGLGDRQFERSRPLAAVR